MGILRLLGKLSICSCLVNYIFLGLFEKSDAAKRLALSRQDKMATNEYVMGGVRFMHDTIRIDVYRRTSLIERRRSVRETEGRERCCRGHCRAARFG